MSLLGDVVDENIPDSESQNEIQESNISDNNTSWFIDDDVPGVGDRPEWLPKKYNSAKALGKAYSELEKRLGTAPKEYDFSKGESWIEPDYEPFSEMAEFAKQHHVPQAVMDKMLETVGLYLDEFRTDISEEKSKLGEDADSRLKVLNNWAKSNLSEQSFQALTSNMRTADSILALEEIRQKMIDGATMIPSEASSGQSSQESLQEYRSELQENYDKFKKDPAYRAKMQKKLESIVKS